MYRVLIAMLVMLSSVVFNTEVSAKVFFASVVQTARNEVGITESIVNDDARSFLATAYANANIDINNALLELVENADIPPTAEPQRTGARCVLIHTNRYMKSVLQHDDWLRDDALETIDWCVLYMMTH